MMRVLAPTTSWVGTGRAGTDPTPPKTLRAIAQGTVLVRPSRW
jgi:hypothetical protein